MTAIAEVCYEGLRRRRIQLDPGAWKEAVMGDGDGAPTRARWARLRFMIIGSLLASPPDKGELRERIQELADQEWEHPTTGEMTRFSFSTLERWFYMTRGDEPDPFGKLARRTRIDAGKHPTISVELGEAVAEQYRDHPSWQYQLHRDNLVALAAEKPELGPVPSYATVSQYMSLLRRICGRAGATGGLRGRDTGRS